MVVRGYGGLVDFIVKPAEMLTLKKRKQRENGLKVEDDTPLREQVPGVEKFADILGDYEHERIRILMLKEERVNLKDILIDKM